MLIIVLSNIKTTGGLIRILQWGEDRRFDEMRSNLGKLAVFWIFQVPEFGWTIVYKYILLAWKLGKHSWHGWHLKFNLLIFLQAVWVWTVSLPVTVVNASDRKRSLQAEDIIGWIMWSIGFLIEAAADQQKLTFKNSPESRGKWCAVGLWKYTRHPNYFGEVSVVVPFRVHISLVWLLQEAASVVN